MAECVGVRVGSGVKVGSGVAVGSGDKVGSGIKVGSGGDRVGFGVTGGLEDITGAGTKTPLLVNSGGLLILLSVAGLLRGNKIHIKELSTTDCDQ